MRIKNCTNERIVIEPGEWISLRGSLEYSRTMSKRVKVLFLQENE